MSDEYSRIEEILTRYRPVGPPVRLRERIVQSVEYRPSSWPKAVGWALTAMLVLSIGLNIAAESITKQTINMLQVYQIEWTSEAQEAADLLNGDGWGRQYVALVLATSDYQSETYSPRVGLTDISGDLR
ncbi:MAG: hypothetical protein JSV03_07370 [Planctomycetota bacterium]|nr:MAG: hypothetical protein JSV03_07370 [Planctomycetota bacterium]